MIEPRLALAALALAGAIFVPALAHADPDGGDPSATTDAGAAVTDAGPGMMWAPVDFVIHGSSPVPDTEVVLLGCLSPDERVGVALTGFNQRVRCEVRGPVHVHVIAKKSAKPLEDAIAKDAGVPEATAKRLVSSGLTCGKIEEGTLVPLSKGITLLTTHYKIDVKAEKGALKDCTVTHVGETIPQTEALHHPPKKPDAGPPPAEPAVDAGTAAPADSGGCGKCGCRVVRTTTLESSLIGAGVLGLAATAAMRRRRR